MTSARSAVESLAFGINDRGQIVGSYDQAYKAQLHHAFVWENGKMRHLGTLGGPRGDASEINERSQIVGSADIKTDRGFNISHAVLWTWQPAK